MNCQKHNIAVTNCSRYLDCKNCKTPETQPQPTPKTIEKWVKTHKNVTPLIMFDGWDRKVWNRSYDDIIEYIMDRFKTTLFEEEYYICMLYLTKSIEKETLYVPFKQSLQYLTMISGRSEDNSITQKRNVLVHSRHIVKSYQKFTIKR